MDAKGNHTNQRKTKDQKNLLEWAVFWVSLLLVMTILGYLSYQVYVYTPSSPVIWVEVQPEPTTKQPNRYHVLVHNDGAITAEAVKVEVVLQEDGEEVEKVELEMMWVPQESRREAWANFTRKPTNANTVSARVLSYQKP